MIQTAGIQRTFRGSRMCVEITIPTGQPFTDIIDLEGGVVAAAHVPAGFVGNQILFAGGINPNDVHTLYYQNGVQVVATISVVPCYIVSDAATQWMRGVRYLRLTAATNGAAETQAADVVLQLAVVDSTV